MTDYSSPSEVEKAKQQQADAFGLQTDPLAEFEPKYERLDIDPFGLFIEEGLDDSLDESTVRQYESVYDEFKEFMEKMDRHWATPNEDHVARYISWLLNDESDPRPHGRPNAVSTVEGKLQKLNKAYEHWQEEPSYPHPGYYNPITRAKDKFDFNKLKEEEVEKMEYDISIQEMREHLEEINHLRSLAIIAAQLKLGLRAGEVVNIRLEDFLLDKTEVRQHYEEMGSHPRLQERPNAIYIPPRNERDGNKSQRVRVLPLDDEMQRVLLRYLLIRPDNDEPWLFLSQKSHSQLTPKRVNEVWKAEFRPEYGETEWYRPVRSHYGRHFFTTYWRVDQDLNRELVRYMRGEKLQQDGSIDEYIHTYYSDIEEPYRDRIFRLGL